MPGKTWTAVDAMKGQSIRALTQAPSNPKIWIAGTLKGVFRSEDSGVQWTQISPAGSMSCMKWSRLPSTQGSADDVCGHMAPAVEDHGWRGQLAQHQAGPDRRLGRVLDYHDPSHPNTVYTSACSGIYRSDTGGELYKKIQGIPMTARRTRVLMLDPTNPNTVYAGTTEGLYKTLDGGATFKRMTAGGDRQRVYVDPKNPST